MCGISGVLHYLNEKELNLGADVKRTCSRILLGELYESLALLQHRGQDAAGIFVNGRKGHLYPVKGLGLVKEVLFPTDNSQRTVGPFNKSSGQRGILDIIAESDEKVWMGIGHVRYPTTKSSRGGETQPFYNGNITNVNEIKEFLDKVAHRHVNSLNDSELLLNLLAYYLQETKKVRLEVNDVFGALESVFAFVKGSYSCISMIAGFGLLAFRDPYGVRPLCFGRKKSLLSSSLTELNGWMVASESAALQVSEYMTDFRDVRPGEMIFISSSGQMHCHTSVKANECSFQPCIFEYVYFSRADSVIDGISVHRSRLKMGEFLAHKIKSEYPDLVGEIDVVMPVPDTSRTATIELAAFLNKTYREGFTKNHYVGRTFIMASGQRKSSVRRKLNPIKEEFEGKRVLLVDDSIVRGTTSREIIQMARESGALAIYFASCSPPIRFPNVYGMDIPSQHELIAYNRTDEEIAAAIGADRVIFQDLARLKKACISSMKDPNLSNSIVFETSVFDGSYLEEFDRTFALGDGKRQKMMKDEESKEEFNSITKVNNGISEAIKLAEGRSADLSVHSVLNFHK